MITGLSLENFKSFKSLDNLKIKPLTILLGRNSCGKSSIIQSLLLLKQTINEENDSELNVEGKYLKFSSLKDISYGVPKVNQASIAYKIGIEKEGKLANINLEFKNKRIEDSYIPTLSKFIYSNGDSEIDFKKINEKHCQKI